MKKIKIAIIAVFILLLAGAGARAADKLYETHTFHSAALGAEKPYNIFLPPGYNENSEQRYPVIYLLHGYNFIRNDPTRDAPAEEHNHWAQQENVPEIAICLMTKSSLDEADKCITDLGVETPNDIIDALKTEYPDIQLPLPPMIVVMPDGAGSFFMNRADGKPLWPPLDGPMYVEGIRQGATGNYETCIAQDLVEHIDETYRTKTDRANRGIGGFSMGGIGSMFMLLRHPDVFYSVTSHSAVYTLSDWTKDPFFLSYAEQTVPEILHVISSEPSKPGGKRKPDKKHLKKYDPYTLLRDFDRKDVLIYFDTGSKDSFAGMNDFRGIKKFVAGLEKKGLPSWPAEHIIPATEGNGNGMHGGRYWRSRVGVILTFHANAFGES